MDGVVRLIALIFFNDWIARNDEDSIEDRGRAVFTPVLKKSHDTRERKGFLKKLVLLSSLIMGHGGTSTKVLLKGL